MCFSLRIYIRECVKSEALEGGLSFRPSLASEEVLQPACCCSELKVTGFHLTLVFTASPPESREWC